MTLLCSRLAPAAAAAVLALCVCAPPVARAAADGLSAYGRVDLNLTRIQGRGWQVAQASTSRFGLRVSESLGDGVKALLQLEARIDADTGRTESRFWGRESWVGLQGPWGRVRLGRSLSPSQRVASNYDPHGTDGIGSFGSSGLLLGLSALVRLENAVYLETPVWRGLSAFGALQLDEGAGPPARVRSLRLRYAAGGLDVSLARGSTGHGSQVTSIGAAADLGPARPMLQWHTGRHEGLERTSALVGATFPLRLGEVRLAWSRQDERAGNGRRHRSLAALGHDHALSKRTQLYATVIRQRSLLGAVEAGVEAGVRHSF